MKRLGLVFVLTLAIASLLVIGCGGGGEGEEATATPGVTATPTPETRGELPGTYKYTYVFSMPYSTMTYKVWVKDGKWRVEETVTQPGGEESAMLYISKEGYDYMIQDNVAMKYLAGSNPAANILPFVNPIVLEEDPTFYFSEAAVLAELQAGCAASPECQGVDIVGHEIIAGHRCTVFESVGQSVEGREARMKMWVATDIGWPIKMEGTILGETSIMEFKDIDLDPTIPDSLFELPAGVEIQEMP